MAAPLFSLSSLRNFKDLRAAVRHGDAIMVRRINPSVISRVATTSAEKNTAIADARLQPVKNSNDVLHRKSLTRDASRLTAVVAGLGGAIWLTGERITTPALAMLALLPAIVILAKSGELSAVFALHRQSAQRAESLRLAVEARRRWLQTVQRSFVVVARSLNTAQALYETRWFGSRARLLRRQHSAFDRIASLDEHLKRARNVEKVMLSSRPASHDLGAIARDGWTNRTFFLRRTLLAASAAAFLNAAMLTYQNRPLAAAIAGLVCSLVLGIRLAVTSIEVSGVERTIRRQSMRMHYPDLLKTVDQSIEDDIDALIAIYENGLDVHVDPFEDIEPQLRRQLDAQIVASQRNDATTDILDFESLREIHRPSAS